MKHSTLPIIARIPVGLIVDKSGPDLFRNYKIVNYPWAERHKSLFGPNIYSNGSASLNRNRMRGAFQRVVD